METKYLLFAGLVIVVLASATVTGMTVAGQERGCDVQPYESAILETGEKTVCSEGDLVNTYTTVNDTWVFIDEYEAPYALSAVDAQKSYECYACPSGTSIWLWLIPSAIAVLAVVGYIVFKKKR